jgi:cyclophilin family peptidyl-prolyl cis-trans isomerase
MIKKISIGVVVIAFLLGAVAVWFKTRPIEESKEVLGEGVTLNTQDTKPDTSFGEEAGSPTIVPTAVQTITPTAKTVEKGPYPMEIDTKKSYEAILKTGVGDITIVLTASATPITVNNFVALSRKSFYNNTIFHRVISGFMIQGGDPNGNGSGGPGYSFADEPFTWDYTRGTVAMANAGPNTNGSQFFIVHKDTGLPKNYVIFGKVISGIEVVDKIATAPTKSGGEGSTPVNPVKIESIQIVEQ